MFARLAIRPATVHGRRSDILGRAESTASVPGRDDCESNVETRERKMSDTQIPVEGFVDRRKPETARDLGGAERAVRQ